MARRTSVAAEREQLAKQGTQIEEPDTVSVLRKPRLPRSLRTSRIGEPAKTAKRVGWRRRQLAATLKQKGPLPATIGADCAATSPKGASRRWRYRLNWHGGPKRHTHWREIRYRDFHV